MIDPIVDLLLRQIREGKELFTPKSGSKQDLDFFALYIRTAREAQKAGFIDSLTINHVSPPEIRTSASNF